MERRTKDEGRRTQRHALYATCPPKPWRRRMRYAQSVLEATVAYAVVAAIFSATMAVFGWGAGHIGGRQVAYEGTRMIAGTPKNRSVTKKGAQKTVTKPVWPVYSAGGGAVAAAADSIGIF